MKTIACLPLVLLVSCTDRALIYTGTQAALNVQGIKNNVPEKVSIGYDRNEFGWFPNGANSSARGSFDAEFSPTSGLAISDSLTTGEAAGGDPVDEKDVSRQCMLVTSSSKFNLGIEAGNPDGVAPTFNAGFKRSIFALFPKTKGELPSTHTAMSVHASGLTGKIDKPKGLSAQQHLQSENGVRVVQSIATGDAAVNLVNKATPQTSADKSSAVSALGSPAPPATEKPTEIPITPVEPIGEEP
jgi:hypothetical protein